jgi:hypothetical protein
VSLLLPKIGLSRWDFVLITRDHSQQCCLGVNSEAASRPASKNKLNKYDLGMLIFTLRNSPDSVET